MDAAATRKVTENPMGVKVSEDYRAAKDTKCPLLSIVTCDGVPKRYPKFNHRIHYLWVLWTSNIGHDRTSSYGKEPYIRFCGAVPVKHSELDSDYNRNFDTAWTEANRIMTRVHDAIGGHTFIWEGMVPFVLLEKPFDAYIPEDCPKERVAEELAALQQRSIVKAITSHIEKYDKTLKKRLEAERKSIEERDRMREEFDGKDKMGHRHFDKEIELDRRLREQRRKGGGKKGAAATGAPAAVSDAVTKIAAETSGMSRDQVKSALLRKAGRRKDRRAKQKDKGQADEKSDTGAVSKMLNDFQHLILKDPEDPTGETEDPPKAMGGGGGGGSGSDAGSEGSRDPEEPKDSTKEAMGGGGGPSPGGETDGETKSEAVAEEEETEEDREEKEDMEEAARVMEVFNSFSERLMAANTAIESKKDGPEADAKADSKEGGESTSSSPLDAMRAIAREAKAFTEEFDRTHKGKKNRPKASDNVLLINGLIHSVNDFIDAHENGFESLRPERLEKLHNWEISSAAKSGVPADVIIPGQNWASFIVLQVESVLGHEPLIMPLFVHESEDEAREYVDSIRNGKAGVPLSPSVEIGFGNMHDRLCITKTPAFIQGSTRFATDVHNERVHRDRTMTSIVRERQSQGYHAVWQKLTSTGLGKPAIKNEDKYRSMTSS